MSFLLVVSYSYKMIFLTFISEVIFLFNYAIAICWPSVIFSDLLKQTMPLTFKPPEMKPSVSSDHLQRCQLHLWLNYWWDLLNSVSLLCFISISYLLVRWCDLFVLLIYSWCLSLMWRVVCSLLLELQGFRTDVIEAYETALSSLRSVTDLRLVWKRYLLIH